MEVEKNKEVEKNQEEVGEREKGLREKNEGG